MHVLYFHQHFSTPKGASGTRSYEMAQALLREGHTVTMVCGSKARGQTGLEHPFKKGVRRGLVEGMDIIEFDLGYGNELGFARRMIVFTKFALRSIGVALREPAEVVFATTTPLTAGIPGIIARWFKRKPFVFEVRDLWPELPREMGVIRNPVLLFAMSMLEWVSYRSADRLIGLSPGIVQGIEGRGVSSDRITMVPNGCDLELFGASHNAWRPSAVRDDQLMAVFSGTHGKANGLNAVLDAAAELKARERNDVRFVLIGDGSEKPRLKQRARAEGLDNVVFLDPVPKIELAGLLAGADLGLQILRNVPAFYFGTSPNKFFDYISSGLPVLNNYPGWLAEIISKNGCGYAVPPNDAEAFANVLIAAAEDREGLQAMGQRARGLAAGQFARSSLAREWVAWVCGAARR
ncbi:glycosyltransferase WbuB [Erythrobacter sp. HI00D59]|nr:glycosyltransferase WbuB [Erythrobacter sp. HI00D59]